MEKLSRSLSSALAAESAFAGLGIFVVMVGLSFDPVLALRSGGVLLLILLAGLLLKAQHVARTDYRRTEAWLLLDRAERPDETHAGRTCRTALREAYLVCALDRRDCGASSGAAAALSTLVDIGWRDTPSEIAVSVAAHAATMPCSPSAAPGWSSATKQPRRIDRPRHLHLSRRQRAESERPVIGLVADEDDERPAGLPRLLHGKPHQRLAVALPLVGRVDDERAEQQARSRLFSPTRDRRHAHRADQRAVALRQE